MCFKQDNAISTLNDILLKLVEHFTYFGSHISSTERLRLLSTDYRPYRTLICLIKYHPNNSHVSIIVSIIVQGSLNKFPDFFRMALLLIVHTWNSSPLRINLPRLQYTCCTVPTTSGRLHRSPLVWACQWPSSQPLSSPQFSHNDSLWA